MQNLSRGRALLIVVVCTFSACGPFGPFDPAQQPPPPDYDLLENWACRPDTDDYCDNVPPNSGLIDNQATAEADCFAVLPCTYWAGSTWNADPQDELMNQFGDLLSAQGQFSAFNGTCKIYSPRYRETHFGALFWDKDKLSFLESLQLGYSDVERAFDYYLENYNEGRPFFLVGHSLGSLLLDDLVRNRIEGTALADSFVAAYIIGGQLPPDSFTEIPDCNDPLETRCVVGWHTVAEDYAGDFAFDRLMDIFPGDRLCTNPLSWTVGGVGVPASQNPGSVSILFQRVEPGLVGASCREDGLLGINPLPPFIYWLLPGAPGNYHMSDYALFYISIRENAQDRLDSYLQ